MVLQRLLLTRTPLTRASLAHQSRSHSLFRPLLLTTHPATTTIRSASSSSPSSSESASATSGGSRSKEASETGSSPTGGKISSSSSSATSSSDSEGTRGLKEDGSDKSEPKISSRFTPGLGQDEPSSEDKRKEVEQHNREFEQGHDRAPPAPAGDKVDKKFWSGKGGADKEP